ncbi:PREDICTED: putative defensin-like protein 253 [Camelina sativa]|uniref:Defensin-like protein 253 n=1 Tax=Camelina sativa TaxID=90675 RepID=A0ABM0XS42_CAMSA|nr:PREDICTED: putative defensin-like protein 253 [Camelina sativa]
MRFASLFVVSCIFLFLVISHVKEIEAVQCEIIEWFDDKCGADGNKTCIEHLIKGHIYDFPRCDCRDAKPGILCTCLHRLPCVPPYIQQKIHN